MKVSEAYSCLAIGADQLFADLIIVNKIPLTAIIPCKDYETTFDIKGLKNYKKLLKLSTKTIQINFQKPSEAAFLEAGKTVINYSDILFAVWNNLPSMGLGGTADIVSFARSLNKKIIHFNPVTKTKNLINYS